MNISNQPLVSIVVPSYNHERFIADCILSIYSQTFKNIELTVIDDGSIDGSVSVLEKLRNLYNFTLIKQANKGIAATLNRGYIEYSRGKYLTFCASDDFWAPEKLELQVKFMEENQNYGMVYGKSYMVDEYGKILQLATDRSNKNLKGGEIFEDLILMRFHPPVNCLFRSEIFQKIGYYREDIWAEDFDMNLRVANAYPIGFIDRYISYYRTSVSWSKSKDLTFKSVFSHRKSIEHFKGTKHYKLAVKNWHYRNFRAYAGYSSTKLFALKEMFYCIDQCFKIEFLKICVLILVRWR